MDTSVTIGLLRIGTPNWPPSSLARVFLDRFIGYRRGGRAAIAMKSCSTFSQTFAHTMRQLTLQSLSGDHGDEIQRPYAPSRTMLSVAVTACGRRSSSSSSI